MVQNQHRITPLFVVHCIRILQESVVLRVGLAQEVVARISTEYSKAKHMAEELTCSWYWDHFNHAAVGLHHTKYSTATQKVQYRLNVGTGH